MLTINSNLLDMVTGIVRRGLDALVPDGEAFSKIEDQKALRIAEALCNHYGCNIRLKNAPPMEVALAAFDVAHFFGAGVPTSDAFLNNFATTIGTEIFVPERILAGDGRSLTALLAHECEHVVQFKTQGFVMPWWYLTSTEERAGYEANAYGAGQDVMSAMGWDMPAKVEDVAPSLVTSYHLQPEDVTLATNMLRSHLASIQHGVHVTDAAKFTLSQIELYAPDWLRADRRKT